MRLFLLVAAALAASCARPASSDGGPPVPQVKLHGVRLQYFRGAEKVASGTADELTYQHVASEFAASNVVLRLPPRSGAARSAGGNVSGELVIFAPIFRGTLGSRQAVGEGGVVLETGSGLVGKTARASFDGAASSASGTEELSLEGSGYWLASRGFSIDFSSERFTLLHEVKSRFGAAR